VKLFSSVPLLMCALFVMAGAVSGAPSATAQQPGVALPGASAQDGPAPAEVSGSWQVSWTAGKGNQRQATMQIKQNGTKLSGKFQSESGSSSLTGSLQGNRVSFSAKMRKRQASFTGTVDGDKMTGTTEQGASWTATRQATQTSSPTD